MFRTEFPIEAADHRIGYHSSVFLIGSCFSEHISNRLNNGKFSVLSNPFGIIYNPRSISEQIRRHLRGTWVQPGEIFEQAGLYRNFDFHSNVADPDKEKALRLMNEGIRSGKIFLDKCTHLLITFGTSFVYMLNSSGKIVANNHKMPDSHFSKRQLQPEEIINDWSDLIREIQLKYPQIKMVFTVSPVRHLKDGAVENTRSKAVLLHAIHELRRLFPEIYYFPAYELMMDDLRDYRFYGKDMLHPNEVAIDYIWEKFIQNCLQEKDLPILKQVNALSAAMDHKAFYPASKEYHVFKLKMGERVKQMKKEYPFLDLINEELFFSVED